MANKKTVKARKRANPIVVDHDPEDEGGRKVSSILVSKFIRMWPEKSSMQSQTWKRGRGYRAELLLALPGCWRNQEFTFCIAKTFLST